MTLIATPTATILGLGVQNRGRQEPNSADFFGLLPLSSERRKKGESENDREPDQPHGTSAEDGWRESSR